MNHSRRLFKRESGAIELTPEGLCRVLKIYEYDAICSGVLTTVGQLHDCAAITTVLR